MQTLRALACALLLLAGIGAAQAEEKPHVDLVLVLAVDASSSMDDKRWQIQLDGYAAALRSPEVLSAIRSGRHHRIAVTMVFWASKDMQQQLDTWHVIGDEESAERFARLIETARRPYPRASGIFTNIAAAIDFSTRLIVDSGYRAVYGTPRRVIDISGDGDQNESSPLVESVGVSYLALSPLAPVRALAVKAGITINGLPIKDSPRSSIADYYASEVIAGHDAFTITVHDPDDREAFARAVRRKLVLEIS